MADNDDIPSSVSCVDCVNALFFCMGPAHQFDRYYKDGAFDSCRKRLDELTFCLKLKAAGREQAKTMLRQLLKDERTTEGVVWPARPMPLPAPAAPAAAPASAPAT